MAGNTELVEYGIFQDESNIHAHVGVLAKTVYVFPTHEVVELIGTGKYREVSVETDGIITAMGYLVPINHVPHCQAVRIPENVFRGCRFSEGDSAGLKGDKAIMVVKWLMGAGKFPIWLRPEIIEDVQMQISGTDIIVGCRARVQVKCDYRAGNGNGCTGNLFIQAAECNPQREH